MTDGNDTESSFEASEEKKKRQGETQEHRFSEPALLVFGKTAYFREGKLNWQNAN